jgi:hypothetical protein
MMLPVQMSDSGQQCPLSRLDPSAEVTDHTGPGEMGEMKAAHTSLIAMRLELLAAAR